VPEQVEQPGSADVPSLARLPSATRREALAAAALATAGFALSRGGVVESKQKRRKRRRIAHRRSQKRKRARGPHMWELTFSDEFDQGELDRRTWKSGTPWTPTPNDQGELQTYHAEALRMADGALHIVATSDSGAYHSGMVTTFESFAQKYGRFEIRCKFPAGQGFWPAFWLLPANEFGPPEIDVLEALGRETDAVYMNVHWKQKGKKRQAPAKFVGPDFTQDFHTFAVEWDTNKIVWFVDDVERHRVAGRSPDKPMYVLANLAVGGDWPGVPDETTPFPSAYSIDYIRVYRLAPGTGVDAEDRDRPQPDRPEDRDRKKPQRPKNGKREPPKGRRPRDREQSSLRELPSPSAMSR
jgi:hypothetical protein